MSQNHTQIRTLIYIVTLSAISIVVGLIEIPWGVFIPSASFLKLDFSEVIILIALVLVGMKNTMFVIVLRGLARRLVMGMAPDQWLGEAMAILASFSIILAYFLILKLFNKQDKPLIMYDDVELNVSWKEWILGTLLITSILTVVLFTTNFFFVTPLYFWLYGIDTAMTFSDIVNGNSLLYSNVGEYVAFTTLAYIPFNLIKGFLVSTIFFVVKPYLKAIKF